MKKGFYFFVISMLLVTQIGINQGFAVSRKKKTETTKPLPVKKISNYDKLLKKTGCITAKSDFASLHTMNGKVYLEYPLNLLGRELLIASTVTKTSDPSFGTVGFKNNTPLHVKFVKEDSLVYLCEINATINYDVQDQNMKKAISQNYMDPYSRKFSIAAYSPDSSAIVLDVTDLFTKNMPELSPVNNKQGIISISSTLKPDLTSVVKIKAFENNVSITSRLGFDYKISLLTFTLGQGVVTTEATRTILLLPEEKMKPRISDSRIGVFLTEKQRIGMEKDQIFSYTLANRWKLEPKDMQAWQRGDAVEPVKPIVYYLDDAFPEDWKEPLRKGILLWNQAFEEIGFKNAIQVMDFPKDDPNFDPDNLNYSCVRFLPVPIANAMGPSWVDPTTGEIINASVIIWSDISKIINTWRFTQTAHIDSSVRSSKMPKKIVDESLTYIVAHEIGHTLGLMHNMCASNSIPVDSLRSASFTQKYGTTTSIMDYARFNYVAQPTDKGVKLTPPDLGIYDLYAIKWLYAPIAGELTPQEEARITEKWIDDKAGDPRFRYGIQQVYSRYDPTSLEEDLGDNPILAGEYGIKNLKYILKNMDSWIQDDPEYTHREELYMDICSQYFRYLQNVLYNVGGIYLSQVKEGTPGKRTQSVPKNMQKQSLKWVIDELRNSDWVDAPTLTQKFGLGINMSNNVIQIAGNALFTCKEGVVLSSHLSQDPYTPQEYYNDLYNGIMENTIKGRKLTNGDKILQRTFVEQICERISPNNKGGGLFGISSMAPSVDEICVYNLDQSGLVSLYKDKFHELEKIHGRGFTAKALELDKFGSGYNFQRKVNIKLIDETTGYFCNIKDQLKKLVESKLPSVSPGDIAHYKYLLHKLNSIDK